MDQDWDPELTEGLTEFGKVLWVASTDRNLSGSQFCEVLAGVEDLPYRNIVSGPDDPHLDHEFLRERYRDPNHPFYGKDVVVLVDEMGYPTAILLCGEE